MADGVGTPVYLYDIPARTQNHIEPATAAALADLGNIAGIKDSGGGQDTLEDYLTIWTARPDFAVYSGPDHLVHWSLMHGAAGCISGLGNVMPDTLAAILAAHNAGDHAEAKRQQDIRSKARLVSASSGAEPEMTSRMFPAASAVKSVRSSSRV